MCIDFNLLATKNIMQFGHENVMMHPAFKVMDRLLISLIHNNGARIDFFYLHVCVTIL